MVLTAAEIIEITERHRRVDADPRFTDKIAHRDRERLLAHVVRLERQIDNLRERVDRWEPTIGARASMLGRSR